MTGGTLAAAALPIGTDTDASTNGTYLYVFNQQDGNDISQSPWYRDGWATMGLLNKRVLQDRSIHEVDVTAQLPRRRDSDHWGGQLKQDVLVGKGNRRRAGRFSSIYNALCRHLSSWQRLGIDWRLTRHDVYS